MRNNSRNGDRLSLFFSTLILKIDIFIKIDRVLLDNSNKELVP